MRDKEVYRIANSHANAINALAAQIEELVKKNEELEKKVNELIQDKVDRMDDGK